MRKVIAAMQTSVDGYIEDPEAKQDWVANWEDEYGLIGEVDTCVLGNGMYDGYEEYWTSARENPTGKLPFSGELPTPGEVAYAQWAAKTPHIVVSRTRKPEDVKWKNTRVISDLEDIRQLKGQSGRDIHVVGGATLVSSMINARLVDEVRLMVNPVLLGGGKPLFKDVTERHYLKLVTAEPREPGKVYLIYSVESR
jgi:dihydrofolate reductase